VDADYWNGEAGRTWAETHEFMDGMMTPFAEALMEHASLPMRGIVVDVGCGCGATTLMAAQRAPQATVIGVDISSPMLTVARRRATQAESRATFEQADASSARPHADPVDRVISRFGVMFFADPPTAFANLRSWLGPEGRLVATVWGPLADNPWLGDLVEIAKRHTEVPPMDPNSPGPFSLSDRNRVELLLTTAGFDTVTQHDLDVPMRVPGSIEDAVQFAMARGPMARAIVDETPEVRAAVERDVRAHMQRAHDGTGTSLPARARLIIATV
jgi:SAM-dependent methyltransferase